MAQPHLLVTLCEDFVRIDSQIYIKFHLLSTFHPPKITFLTLFNPFARFSPRNVTKTGQ